MIKRKRHKFSVCGVEFGSAKAAVEHTRAIVSSYEDGQMMSGEHARFMLDLIARRHDEPNEKLVPGRIDQIVGIRVKHQSGCPQFGRSKTNVNHCVVVYADGHEIDFSWKSCCEGTFSDARDADHAFRRAVEPQVREYKRRRFFAIGGLPTCDATGVPLTFEGCQVDHHPLTWKALVARFLEQEGISLNGVKTVPVVPEGGCVIADSELEDRFASFHESNATLRLVTPEVNRRSWRDDDAIRP